MLSSEFIKKYPRTPHLPWSKGRSKDDLYLTDISNLEIQEDIIVTEKLDGEGMGCGYNYIHARSLDSKSHPSRDYVKKMHSEFCYNIPENMRIYGENLYGKHSIYYNNLDSYFYVFAIFIDNVCLSWDDTVENSKILGLKTVPVLYRGPWDEEKIKACWTGISKFGPDQEGYVVRDAHSFPFNSFDMYVAKFVRPGHVQTDEFWLSKWSKGIDRDELINHLGVINVNT